MKHPGPISCFCSALLLSSCSLTQQQSPLSAEDLAAQQRAVCELDAALEQEEARLVKEAREAAARARAEEKAREEAERKAEEEAEARRKAEEEAREEAERKAEEEAEARSRAEEEARAEAERKAEEEARIEAERKAEAEDEAARGQRRTPSLLSTRGRSRREEPEKQEKEIVPTAEQQKAAHAMLNEQGKTRPAVKTSQSATSSPAPEKKVKQKDELQLPGSVINGALRTHRFGPPEEEIQRDDDEEPLPNSVEMRGLRSPSMKGNLPMNLDGKIIKN